MADIQLIVKAILGRGSKNAHKGSLFHFFPQRVQFFLAPCKNLNMDRICIICDSKRNDHLSAADLSLIPACDLSMDSHVSHLAHYLYQIDDVGIVKITPIQHVRIGALTAAEPGIRTLQVLPVGILALSKAAIALLGSACSALSGRSFFLGSALLRSRMPSCSRASRRLCLYGCRPGASALTGLPVCILLLRVLQLNHVLDQPGCLLLDLCPSCPPLFFVLLLYKLCTNMQIKAAAFRENLVEHPDQLIRRVLAQRRLPKLQLHDVWLRK